MSGQEGVIKFQLAFKRSRPLPEAQIREINAWREVFFRLGLIGQDPERYGGFGYGNISARIKPFTGPANRRAFVITGSQTGGIGSLGPEHYTTVFEYDSGRNRVVARGPVRPSSEALTHGMVYNLSRTTRFVIHVHSPEIWSKADWLGIPVTDTKAAYGTAQMAQAVGRLFRASGLGKKRIFAMGGHQDGVVSFGRNGEEAALHLMRYLALALQH
jgi:ribulose-5-phosphate 4-epimerase/fuculose-1-phosphate aldolase